MRRYRGFIAWGLMALFLFLSYPTLAQDSVRGRVQSSAVNLRELPNVQSSVLDTVAGGESVEILGMQGDWYHVRTGKGISGYMDSRYIWVVKTGVVENGDKHVNLRAEPSLSSEVLGTCNSGVQLSILSDDGQWMQVETDGVVGYMSSSFVKVLDGPEVLQLAPALTEEEKMAEALGLSTSDLGTTAVPGQYGVSESYIASVDGLTCEIAYPVSGLVAADSYLRSWASALAAQVKAEVASLGEGVQATLEVRYDTNITDGRYVSILETGWLEIEGQENTRDIVHVINIDLSTGELMTYEDIFASPGLDEMVMLFTQRLSMVVGMVMDVVDKQPDAQWLQEAMILPEGIAVFLPKGERLPDTLGSLRLLFTYEELTAASLLAMEAPSQVVASTGIMVGDRMLDPTRPMVALTFDDGPSKTTPKILDLLTEYGGRATFFVVGNRINNFSEELKAIAEQGSEIGCHTWSHQDLEKLSKDDRRSQISQTNNAVEKHTGQTVTLIRPPYGSYNSEVRTQCGSMGLSVILWSIDTEDWRTKDAQATYDAVMSQVTNGSIILCHDLHEATGDAMALVIPELVARGYQLVTVSELLSFREGGMKSGSVYNRLKIEESTLVVE